MQSTNRFRRQVARVLASAALMIIMSILLTSVCFADPPAWDSWDYFLQGPINSTLDPDTGLTMVILGSGSFDTSGEGTIDGGGSYTIYNQAGDAVGSGNWTAEEFGDFEAYNPGNSPGEGGHLTLVGSFTGEGEGALNGAFAMAIHCSMWGDPVNPPGFPWDPDYVHAGPYTEAVLGGVMFNLNLN